MPAGSLHNVAASFLVVVSHFAECRENRPLTVYMRNANKPPKMPYSEMVREVEK